MSKKQISQKTLLIVILCILFLSIVGIVIWLYVSHPDRNNEETVNYIAESEPITIKECQEIYHNNQKSFGIIKDYMLALTKHENKEIYITMTDEEYIKSVSDTEIQAEFMKLKESGVQTIKSCFDESRVEFYIDGTGSSWYGVLWRDNDHKTYTDETSLGDNWYSYFFGGI